MSHVFVIISVFSLYLAAHILFHLPASRDRRRPLAALILVLGGLCLTTVATRQQLAPDELHLAKLLLYVWLGVLFYAVLLLGTVDAVRLTRRLLDRRTDSLDVPPDPERRQLLARAATGIVVLGSGGVGCLGVRNAWDVEHPEVEVRLERLPPALSGFRIVQISDVHLGPLLGQRFLERIVESTNRLAPDLVVLTGDLVDAPPSVLGKDLEPLSRLRARHGVFYVTGNHEYRCDAQAWLPHLGALGAEPLLNRRVPIGDRAPGGASFDLVGIPDATAGSHVPEHAPDLEAALAGRDPERELVLLAHRPSQITSTEGHGVGLQLSGHTHGGQLLPFGLIAMLAEPYLSGHHHRADGTQIYVTRGAGFVGPAMRVLAPAEIPLIVLT